MWAISVLPLGCTRFFEQGPASERTIVRAKSGKLAPASRVHPRPATSEFAFAILLGVMFYESLGKVFKDLNQFNLCLNLFTLSMLKGLLAMGHHCCCFEAEYQIAGSQHCFAPGLCFWGQSQGGWFAAWSLEV